MKYLGLALLIASTGAFFSFFFTLVMHWEACNLCLYQRICFLTLVGFLAFSFYQRWLIPYFLFLPLFGGGIAIYQIFFGSCNGILCSYRPIIPSLSLIGFLMIFLFLLLAKETPSHELKNQL